MTPGFYTNETKGFVKDPNHSGSGSAATSGKYTANEPQRALSAQQEENYNAIPTFNIITIFIALFAGQEQAYCIVSSQNMWILNSFIKKEWISKHYDYLFIFLLFISECLLDNSFPKKNKKRTTIGSKYWSGKGLLEVCMYVCLESQQSREALVQSPPR